MIGILLLVVRFVKNSDQTIIHIIRKNKSVLMFLINPSTDFTETYLKSSQHLRRNSLWYYQFAAFSHQLILERFPTQESRESYICLWISITCSTICAGVQIK